MTLVDTQGQGVERITPRGAVALGQEYPLDCLIFATGFDFLTEFNREIGVDFVGKGGQLLSEHWSEGPRTFFGNQTHGFPNFFVTGLSQTGVAINFIHSADEQTKNIVYIIEQCLERGYDSVQPTHEAEEGWVKEILAGSDSRKAFYEACTPGYYNYEGKRRRATELNEFYAAGAMPYIALLEKWREDGKLAGLEFTRPE